MAYQLDFVVVSLTSFFKIYAKRLESFFGEGYEEKYGRM